MTMATMVYRNLSIHIHVFHEGGFLLGSHRGHPDAAPRLMTCITTLFFRGDVRKPNEYEPPTVPFYRSRFAPRRSKLSARPRKARSPFLPARV